MKLSLPHPVHRIVSAVLATAMFASSVLSSASLAVAGNAPPIDDRASKPPGVSAEASPTVLREIETSRTAESSTYLMSDGSFAQVIYEQPVHYRDRRGQWAQIDPTLVPTTQYGVSHTRASEFDIAIASDDATGDPVSVTHGDWKVGMKLLGGEQSGVLALGNEAVYPLAMSNTALTYETGPNAVKDTLVLQSKNAPDTFTFHLSLKGLALYSSLRDGGYVLLDSKGKMAGRIEPLLVFDSAVDAAGDPASECTSATVTMAPADDGVNVTYHVPRSWLDDPARVYPVKVDPQVVFANSSETCDTFYSSANKNTSYASANHLDVGRFPGTDFRRTLLSFAMQSLPAGIQIDRATLQMYCYANSSGSASNVNLYGVDKNWHGGAHYTWANTFGNSYLKWNSRADGVASRIPGGSGQYVSWYPTAIVQSWYDGGRPAGWGLGFLLMANGESSSPYRSFWSSKYTTYTGRQPHLTVNYTLPSISGGFDRTVYQPGDLVTARVRVATKNPSASTDVEARVVGRDAQGNAVNCGGFSWDAIDGFSCDADYGDDQQVVLEPRACSTTTDGGGRTVNFAYRIQSGYGDVQANRLLVADSDWASTPLADTGASYSVQPTPLSDVPSAVTTASAGWFAEADADGDGINDANNDTNASGRGSISLSWAAAPAATRYGIYLYDGRTFRKVASTSSTSWSSAGAGVYPADTAISEIATGASASPFVSGSGLDLRDDPRALYAKTSGTAAGLSPVYYAKVVPINSAGESAISQAPTVTVELANRSKHLRDDPRHTSADLGSLFGNDAEVRLDKGDLVLSATDLAIPGLGPEVALTRAYRSSVTASRTLAPGWRFSFERSLVAGQRFATYFDEVGDAHVFTCDGTIWTAPKGDTDVLSVDGSGVSTLRHKDRTSSVFDPSGRLVAESDASGNTVHYDWSGDGSTLVVRTPNDSPAHQRRIAITFAGGKVVSAVAHVSGGDVDRSVTYTVSPNALTVEQLPGTDSEQTTVYRYDGSSRVSAVAVPGFTPSSAGEAVWSVAYPDGSSICVTNGTGAGTQPMPRTISWDATAGTGTMITATGRSTLAFDPLGEQVLSTAENTSAATVAVYDADGNVIRESSPSGRTTSGIFDGRGNPVASIDENGAVTTYTYSDDLCVSEVDARGAVTTRSYDPATGQLLAEDKTLNAGGDRSHVEFAYNSDGSMQSEKRAIDASHTLQIDYADYADCGDAQTVTQNNVELSDGAFRDLVAHTFYDGFGDIVRTVDASGVTTVVNDLDAAGRTIGATDASGTITHTRYGVLGTEAKSWRSHPATSTFADWTESVCNGAGDVISTVVRASSGATVSVTVHSYDAAGREIKADDSAVPGVSVTHYDAQGNVDRTWEEGADTSSAISAARACYNSEGEVTVATEPGAADASELTSYTRNGDVAQTTDADGATTRYEYDEAGDLVGETMVGTDVGDVSAEYAQDLDGRTTTEVDEDETTTTITYNLDGDQTGVQLGTQPVTSVRVNVLGWPLSKRDFDGVITSNSYDAMGRVVRTSVGDLVTGTAYDACGRAVRQVTPDGTVVATTYDVFGRKTGSSESTGSGELRHTAIALDGLGRITAQTDWSAQWPGLRTRLATYAADGTVTEVEMAASADATMSTVSDGAGLLRSWTAEVMGLAVDCSVAATDLAGRVTATTSHALPTSRTADFTETGQYKRMTLGSTSSDYAYSPTSGKKSSDTVHLALGSKTEVTSYVYDGRERLTSAVLSGTTTSYAYDPTTGALCGIKRGAEATKSLSYESNGTGRLVAAGDRVYASDSLGRRIRVGTPSNPAETTLEWAGDRLVGLAGPAGVSRYTYDGSGQRTSSVVTTAGLTTTTCYDYEGTCLLGLSATRSDGASWVLRCLYDGSGRLFGGVYRSDTTSPTAFLAETTDRGDVRELLDAAGSAFAGYSYDAYGVSGATTTTSTGKLSATQAAEIASRQPLRYAGYTYDPESALYYCSARYYDSAVGAFISKDPAVADGQESPYQYCAGDPVGRVDPSGAIFLSVRDRASFKRIRKKLVAAAKKLVKWRVRYSHGDHVQKPRRNGQMDCSGAVAWIFRKGGKWFQRRIPDPTTSSRWNTDSFIEHLSWKTRRWNAKRFAPGRGWQIGDVLVKGWSHGRMGHIVMAVADGPRPKLFECAGSRLGKYRAGARLIPYSVRMSTWHPKWAGRFFDYEPRAPYGGLR